MRTPTTNSESSIFVCLDVARPTFFDYFIEPNLRSRPESNWVSEAKNQIEEIKGVHPEWKPAFHWANSVLAELNHLGLEPDRIVPSAEDGVCFYFFGNDGYAMVECLASGEIMALMKDETSNRSDVKEIDQDQTAIREAAAAISSFKRNLAHEDPTASPDPA